uniref:Glyoxalase domain containing 4 n=2 Tax=Eptatretus burgeri TaxID=7764 RepID=A0A8C4PXI4_EPTBU
MRRRFKSRTGIRPVSIERIVHHSTSMAVRRALHFVVKVGHRDPTVSFYRDILAMKILRHEEFEEGCKASCNGPYDGKWSKTMVGYGPEDNHFVVELTYNYGIGGYRLGNDFLGITIQSSEAICKVRQHGWPIVQEAAGAIVVEAPGGYKFHLLDKPQPKNADPVQKVTLGVSNLERAHHYWTELCGMNLYGQEKRSILLGYTEDQCKLELRDVSQAIDHGTAFGRIAFACPRVQLPTIQETMENQQQTVLTPLLSLDTPGKATVEVVIVADPDGHEICFVGDESFRQLSYPDPTADHMLNEAMEADKSDEWFLQTGKQKQQV